MAYFANGSEGDYFTEKYCSRCVHRDGCPVWGMHFLWSYDACNGDQPGATAEEQAKHFALNALWPRTTDGQNAACAMFYEAARKAGE